MSLKIGEVARRTGATVRALRYYEEQGLLQPGRTSGGQRLYGEDDIERVMFYQRLYAGGLTSSHIQKLLPCIHAGHTDAEQRAMLHRQRTRIQRKVDDLTDVLARLDQLIELTRDHP